MGHAMTADELRTFLQHGTRTGKLATTRKDGRPHVAPIWFVLDGDDVVFLTGAATVKGRTLRRTGQAAMVVDDDAPPYSYVLVEGSVSISDDLEAMLPYSIRIGERYMGPERGEQYGRRNAVDGEIMVRLTPTVLRGEADVAD